MKNKTRMERLAALLAGLGLILGSLVAASPAQAVGNFANSLIADRAELRSEYQWAGQCKKFANDVVSEASGGTLSIAGGYQQRFADVGAIEISSANAVRGDIIQVTPAGSTDATAESMHVISNPARQLHTAIILANNGSGNFWVIDSNSNGYPEQVHRHSYSPYVSAAGSIIKIWRLGQVTVPVSDSDGDGVADSNDLQPNIAGPYNNRGVPLQTSNLGGDFNGDGHEDIALFYDYYAGTTKILAFYGTGGGHFAAPVVAWDSGLGNWEWNRFKPVVGDFNNDAITDIAGFYDYGNGQVKIWLFTGSTTGTFPTPTVEWDSGVGSWEWNRVQPLVGDFNGDGDVDITALYDYTGASRLLTLNGDGAGNLAAPIESWYSGAGNWEWENSKPLTGDFNNDGKSDVMVFYDYGNGQVKIWGLYGTANSTFTWPSLEWDSGVGSWEWNRVMPFSGDFNGDGKHDLVALYDYGSSTSRLFAFNGDGAGNLAAPQLAWFSGNGNWSWHNTKAVVGDFDGDGKSDIGALYNYGSDLAKIWEFHGSAASTFATPTLEWSSGVGNWEWKNSLMP